VYGVASVTLDKRPPVLVDLYSDADAWQQTVWDSGALLAGEHTLTIRWTGKSNGHPDDTKIGIDALSVSGELIQATGAVVDDGASDTSSSTIAGSGGSTGASDSSSGGGVPWLRWLIEAVVIIVAAAVFIVGFKRYVVRPFTSPSSQVEEAVRDGDQVRVNRIIYHIHPPRKGDIILVQPQSDGSGAPAVKRITTKTSDAVVVRDGKLYINGVAQEDV